MKYLFVINPASGKSATKEGLEERISECAAKKNIEVQIKITDKPGDTAEYIAELADTYPKEELKVYVCGGDGTLCEAVNGIMRIDGRERICLGAIPVGTGNDFVRNFGERELFLNIDAQLDAHPTRIDLLKCNDIYSINMINIGFDCQVVVRTSTIKKKKLVPSKLAYICGLLVTLIKKPGTRMSISDGQGNKETRELLLSTFANGSYCGGGFYSNPNACLDDGMINSLFVKNISRTAFLRLVSKYKKGLHLSGEYDHILSSEKSKSYSLVFDEMTDLSIDGEIVVADKAYIECVEGALKFLVPRGANA